MRITDLYDLKKNKKKKKIIKDCLMEDIESLARAQFKDDEFRRFQIKVKLVPIKTMEDYK